MIFFAKKLVGFLAKMDPKVGYSQNFSDFLHKITVIWELKIERTGHFWEKFSFDVFVIRVAQNGPQGVHSCWKNWKTGKMPVFKNFSGKTGK